MIKTLMGSIREYKKPSILTPILVSIEVIVECIIPFYIAKLIDHIQNGTDMSLIFKIRLYAYFIGVRFAVLRRYGGQDLRHGFMRVCEKSAARSVLQGAKLFIYQY